MFTHAAAISYYMIFSLPSMLLIILWTAAHFYKEVTVHDAIFQKMTALVGDKAAELILVDHREAEYTETYIAGNDHRGSRITVFCNHGV